MCNSVGFVYSLAEFDKDKFRWLGHHGSFEWLDIWMERF
jgi:hypothetical protein